MFFEFFKNLKTKTLLIVAGFLIIAGFVGLSFWLYFNFLKSDESFLEIVPAEAVAYWQSDFNRGEDDAWLWAITRSMLSDEAASQTKFLEESIGPKASKVGFAILPDFVDFIFFGKINESDFNAVRIKLEELNYHYIFENGGRVIISNSRFGLEEAMSTLSQEKKSLADNKMKLIALNSARRHSAAQIYFGGNFKVNNFKVLPWSSDIWVSNKLIVTPKLGTEPPRNLADFNFLAVLDNEYLKKNMEGIIKDDLAVLFPEIKERILSDGTKVKELLANPDIFSFQNKQIGSFSARYLSVPDLSQEFLVGVERQKMIFSNSDKMMEDFLTILGSQPDYYGKNLIELISDWLKWLTADFGGVILGVNVDNL
ncbi:MAG: hypothetical protein WC445_03560 [Patescibacteria group bacterium]